MSIICVWKTNMDCMQDDHHDFKEYNHILLVYTVQKLTVLISLWKVNRSAKLTLYGKNKDDLRF